MRLKITVGLCVLLSILSCGLFKNTSKTKTTDNHASINTADASLVDLSKVTKETNLYLYRTDGSLYGHQNTKKQLDQSRFETIRLKNEETSKKDIVVKETTPDKRLIYIAGALLILGLLAAYWKLMPRLPNVI